MIGTLYSAPQCNLGAHVQTIKSNPNPQLGGVRNLDGVGFHKGLPHNSGIAKKPKPRTRT